MHSFGFSVIGFFLLVTKYSAEGRSFPSPSGLSQDLNVAICAHEEGGAACLPGTPINGTLIALVVTWATMRGLR